RLDAAMKTLTDTLRPWTIDFHVAQNDATVKGSGTHDKTGHHCLPNDPNGKLAIARHAAYWLKGSAGQPTEAIRHVCWDGCMFPNEVMMKADTWNDILRTMIAVRDAHGWTDEPPTARVEERPVRVTSARKAKPAPRKPAKAKAVKRAAKQVRAKRVIKKKLQRAKTARKAKGRKTPIRKAAPRRKARR
ncbi:MAG TPA: hypothetical protein VJA21_00130, partial [Verrucomicrobiae bacterium]